MHASMETALAFMNHFPLFAVMLRLKDPARLPGQSIDQPKYVILWLTRFSLVAGGLQFELLEGKHGEGVYLKMTVWL